MNDALAAAVVHDLKNALVSLASSAQGIAERSVGTELETETGGLHVAAVSLAQRLAAFLTLYRSGQAGLAVRLCDHTPDEFLRDVVAGLVLPPDAVPINTSDGDASPAFWFFDDYLTRMALEAALSNALRFARNRIDLACSLRDGFLVFSVADDGPGLGAQGSPSTGLGTAICEAIARAHTNGARSGKVALQNRPEGGALFELWLP